MSLNGVAEMSNSAPNGVATLTDDLRPKLRNDVVFLRVDTGIYLRSPETSCVLKGKGAYEWLAALGARVTGRETLGQVCEGLDPAPPGSPRPRWPSGSAPRSTSSSTSPMAPLTARTSCSTASAPPARWCSAATRWPTPPCSACCATAVPWSPGWAPDR